MWRGLAQDVVAWAKTCLHCHIKTRPLHIPVPQRHFSRLNIDLVGLLQFTNNCNFIFTIIDFTSNRIEAIPLSSFSAADCARALVFHWITRFGVPATISSDR